MSGEKYDLLDWAAQRNAAIAFRDPIKKIIEGSLSSPMLTDEDRETLERSKRNLYLFEELDKNFVAPLAAETPSRATRGYEMLWILMSASFHAGSRGTISKSAEIVAGKLTAAKGGQESGATRRTQRNKKWANEALTIAQQYQKKNPGASQDKLAEEIRYQLDDRAPGIRQVKSIVAGWQKTGALAKPLRK